MGLKPRKIQAVKLSASRGQITFKSAKNMRDQTRKVSRKWRVGVGVAREAVVLIEKRCVTRDVMYERASAFPPTADIAERLLFLIEKPVRRFPKFFLRVFCDEKPMPATATE